MPTPREADRGWAQALARAGQITAVLQPPAACTDRHWDFVGIRGVLAIALQALSVQSGRAPENVSLADLVEHCARGAGHVRDLAVAVVGERLALSLDSAPDAPVPTAADPPLATWLWLTRLWPPAAPDDIDGLLPARPPQRWDGMVRGIARRSPGAAIDLLCGHAAESAESAMRTT
ncbi:hypothetical protein ACFU9B_42335 [Streptomyces sp. NPDC057592]|uniref:hypothetical protein n=1 Tax=unclassified Streptomyces TaxID=2593676 RepID=UPI00369AE9DB